MPDIMFPLPRIGIYSKRLNRRQHEFDTVALFKLTHKRAALDQSGFSYDCPLLVAAGGR